MVRTLIVSCFLALIIFSSAFGLESLHQVYLDAGPGGGYDKYIVLDNETDYIGDLVITSRRTVRIIGNGARIFGQPGVDAIQIFDSKLDISGCVIIGGYASLAYMRNSNGTACNNTLVGAEHAGIYDYYTSIDTHVVIYDNIITGPRFGIWAVENYLPVYIGYDIIDDIMYYPYAQYCPG
jgi:hypothetical protein